RPVQDARRVHSPPAPAAFRVDRDGRGGSGIMTLSSRPASPGDEPFVRRLIIETLTEQLQAASWPEPMRAHLLEIQYATRRQGVGAGSPAGESRIIVVNGQDGGWTLVSNPEHEIRLLEIIVLGEHRGTGIGTAAISGVLEAATRSGKPV